MKFDQSVHIRRATAADESQIRALQDAVLRMSAGRDYEPSEIQSFIEHSGTVERDLIASGTYFVAVAGGDIVASGSWGREKVAFEPFVKSGWPHSPDGAVIRGVYCDPAFAARGLARRLLAVIEDDIASWGLARVHLATSYTGMPFFTSAGYVPANLISLGFPDGVEMHGVVMGKVIAAHHSVAA